MTRYFDYLNLTLLILLGSLCVVQWSREKEYGRQLAELRQTSTNQADKLAVQGEAIQRAGEDLEGFKREIMNFKEQADENNALIREQKARIFLLEEEKGRFTHQLADWQKALDEYKKAITGRDDNIKTLLTQREQLVTANKEVAAKANQAVLAYNDLTTKYEDVVNRYNALAARYQSEHAPAASASAPASAK
jgi:chromosome segregation ATPase